MRLLLFLIPFNLSFGFSSYEIQGDFERIFDFGAEGNIETSILSRRKGEKAPKKLEYHVNEPKTRVFTLLAQNHKTPQQIEEELQDTEEQFKRAKEMFNPWYAGPLITPSAHIVPPGVISMQPYLFITDNFARYDHHRHSRNVPDLFQVIPQMGALQTGFTSRIDTTATAIWMANWQSGKYGSGFGDTSLSLGFGLLLEDVFVPALKLSIGETFPSGRYQKLENGVDATGSGAYTTSFGLRIAKLVFWSTQHPLNLRAAWTYSLPSSVKVRGLNTYGGGSETRGRVRPGDQFNSSIGIEWSFTQKWVFANDFVYIYNRKTTFKGNSGEAPVGGPSNDQFSLAPAIEYNPSPNLNFLAGVWFTVTGRNSANFLSGVFSFVYNINVP